MTTVGTLSTDLGPGNGDLTGKTSMDLPVAPDNNVPLIVTTAADEDKADKLAVAPINGEGSISFLQACSKLDMEPNPFEQSFSGLSSDKPGAPPSATEPAVETPKPVLPPIAAMSGRLAPNSDQFSWDAQSLRMGPLSPSMLEGPQDPVMFEKANTNPIPVGSFPATAAPISTIFSSGAPLAESGFPFVGMPAPQSMAPSAGPIQTTEPYQPAMYNQPGPNDRQNMSFAQTNGQPAMNDRYMPPQGGPNHDGGANGYGNLHLLSQAQATHREMWIKRESVDANGHVHSQHPQAQHAHSGAPQNGQVISGMHPGMVAAQQPPRNGAEPSSRNNHRNRMTSEDYSDDSEQSMQSSTNGDGKSKKGNGNDKKRPASDDKMDEEEKRKNFLERNRQAALKCRQRKKQWLTNLQAKVEYLTTDNEHLQTQTASLRDEIIHLKALLLAHKDCPVAQSHGVYAETIGNPSGGMMAHGRGPAHSMQGQPLQHQQQQQQRGSGPRGNLPPPPPPPMQTGAHRMSMGSSSAVAGSAASAAAGVHRPMSMMQDITPSASPSQAQATVRY